jgi:CheY-like chemotaxis protein
MDGQNKKMEPGQDWRQPDVESGSHTVVAVALAQEALAHLPRHVLEPHSYIARVDYEELDSIAFSGARAPKLVLSPLLTPVFDAIDLGRYLSQRGYRGRYLALVDRLPSANLIRREVEAQSPDLNFDVVILDGSSPLHSL